MAIACSIFGHKWKGCICDRCGEKRDQEHDYRNFKASYEKFGCGKCVGTCKCGKIQELDHDWNGCTCRRCGFRRDENHKWSGNTCAICGLPLKDSLEYYRRMIDDKKYLAAYECMGRIEKGPFKSALSIYPHKMKCIELAYEEASDIISRNDYSNFSYWGMVSGSLFQMESRKLHLGSGSRTPYTDQLNDRIQSVVRENLDKGDYRSVRGWLKSLVPYVTDVFKDKALMNRALWESALLCMSEEDYEEALKWFGYIPSEYPGRSEKRDECEKRWKTDPRNPDFCTESPDGEHILEEIPGTLVKMMFRTDCRARCKLCGKEKMITIDEVDVAEVYKYDT